MKCRACNGSGLVITGPGIRGLRDCDICNGTGVIGRSETTLEDACPVCGTLFPTDDRLDFIPVEDIEFCYHCGARVKE